LHLTLADSRALRFFTFTVLYVAQGFPFGLVTVALPAYLAERGVPGGEIGAFIGVAMLPWSFKILAGPMMDRFSFLAMGRRRPWVILAQLGLVLAGVAFAFFPQALENLALLTALCFVLNAFGASQDVAVDGMAIDVLPQEEHGRANAFMAFGQVAGISGSSAIAGFTLLNFGMRGVALMLVVGFGLILALAIAVRERPGEKMLPWSPGQATQRSLQLRSKKWKDIVVDLGRAVFLPASFLMLGVAFLFRLGDGLWITLAPVVVVQQLGYASTDYTSWTAIVSFIAAMAGLPLGLYIDRKGAKPLYGVALGLYGLLAVAVGLSASSWATPAFLFGILILQALVYQGVFVSFIATSMKLCWVKVSATQFAIYMAWANLGRSVGSGAVGTLESRFAYNQMYFLVAIAFFVAMVLVWITDLSAHRTRVEALARDVAR
jgi:PAT family beta-lactamase induction signal transducer AmpG